MKPGDLVIIASSSDVEFIDSPWEYQHKEVAIISPESIGVILEPPIGAWVKWFVQGRIGWSQCGSLVQIKH